MQMINLASIFVGLSLTLILSSVKGDWTEPQDKVVEVHVSSTAAPSEVDKYEALEVISKSPVSIIS